WRPTENSEYFVRYDRSEYTDEELTLREYYRFGQGDARYIAAVSPEDNYFALSNTDLQQHVYIQEAEDTTTTWALGGENIFNDLWTLDYEYHTSKGVQENPDDRRVQFRIRSLPMIASSGQEDITTYVLSQSDIRLYADAFETEYSGSVPGTGGFNAGFSYDREGNAVLGYDPGQRYQPNMRYDNIYLEDRHRKDELSQFELNLQRDFTDSVLNYIKVGVQMKERERIRSLDRWSVDPTQHAAACLSAEAVPGDEEDDTDITQSQRDCLTWANTGIGRGEFN